MSRHGNIARKKRRARLRAEGYLKPMRARDKKGEAMINPLAAEQLLRQIRKHEGLPEGVEWSDKTVGLPEEVQEETE